MNGKAFTLAGGYTYNPAKSSHHKIRALGVEAAQSHGRLIRSAVERAICRFYLVPSLDDCNADKILHAGVHEYHEGIPFRVIDLSAGRFIIQDLKTKTEIAYMGEFQVEREEQDVSTVSDPLKQTIVCMKIQQSYCTFDGVK